MSKKTYLEIASLKPLCIIAQFKGSALLALSAKNAPGFEIVIVIVPISIPDIMLYILSSKNNLIGRERDSRPVLDYTNSIRESVSSYRKYVGSDLENPAILGLTL